MSQIGMRPPGLRRLVTYTPTWEEVVDGLTELLEGDLDVRAEAVKFRRARLKRALVWALLVALAVLSAPTLLRRWIFPNPTLAAAIPSGGLVAFYLLTRANVEAVTQSLARGRAAAHARLKFWMLRQQTQIALCDAGVWISDPRASTIIHWSGMTRCALGRTGVMLATGRLEGYAVPLRAFGDQESAKAFVSEALAAQRAAGADSTARNAELLASIDMTCPSCRYDLAGAATSICPECGATFDLEAHHRRRSLMD